MNLEMQTSIQRQIEKVVTNGVSYDSNRDVDPLFGLWDIKELSKDRLFTDDWELQIHLGTLNRRTSGKFGFFHAFDTREGSREFNRMRDLYLDVHLIGKLDELHYRHPQDILDDLHDYCCVRDKLNECLALNLEDMAISLLSKAVRNTRDRITFRVDVFKYGGYDKLPLHRAKFKDSDWTKPTDFNCSGKCS